MMKLCNYHLMNVTDCSSYQGACNNILGLILPKWLIWPKFEKKMSLVLHTILDFYQNLIKVALFFYSINCLRGAKTWRLLIAETTVCNRQNRSSSKREFNNNYNTKTDFPMVIRYYTQIKWRTSLLTLLGYQLCTSKALVVPKSKLSLWYDTKLHHILFQ